MSNLRPAPIALTPQVVRACLGIGRAKGTVELPVTVSLSDSGARCSKLRLDILRAIKVIGEDNRLIVTASEIAHAVRVSPQAVEEHLAALRNCECIHPYGWRIRLTAKGFQKVSMADFAEREGAKP